MTTPTDNQTTSESPSCDAACSPSFLFCDGCGEIHKETEDFVICECGRIAARMEWASPSQIAGNSAKKIMARLDGYRSSYFMNWFIPLWATDPMRLQNHSVAELVTKYDAEQQLLENAKHVRP